MIMLHVIIISMKRGKDKNIMLKKTKVVHILTLWTTVTVFLIRKKINKSVEQLKRGHFVDSSYKCPSKCQAKTCLHDFLAISNFLYCFRAYKLKT